MWHNFFNQKINILASNIMEEHKVMYNIIFQQTVIRLLYNYDNVAVKINI
jgi:hypothetical protein